MSIETLIDDYCQVWPDADPARRESRLSALWAPGATYADPTVLAHDGADLLRHIERVQASRPGARVLRCTAIDAHHQVARFGFQVIGADGSVLRQGIDLVLLSHDGQRIERVIGFFGELAPRHG